MAKQVININYPNDLVSVGNSANDRRGDPLRTAFSKINDAFDKADANFTELYSAVGADVAIPTQTNNGGKYLTTNGTTLSWGTVATTDTGVIRFNNNTVHTSAGQNMVINPSNDSLNKIVIPGAGNGVAFPLSLTNTEGDVSLTAEGDVVIDALGGDHTWTFGADGNLHLPAGGDIVDSTGTSVLGGSPTSLSLTSLDTGEIFHQTGVIIENAGLTTPASAAISLPTNADTNNPIAITNNTGKVAITAGTGPARTWQFGTDGTIIFPDTTIQSTAFQDVPSHIFFVHPSPGRTFTATGTYNSPFATITAAISAAVTAGHNDSNPAIVVLMANITENVTLAPGIFLTSLGTGTHGSPDITGTITVTSSTGTVSSNHYSISNLRIIAPDNNTNCIYFTGTAPQKLFVRDLWIDAKGTGTGIKLDNTGSGSTVQLDIAHIAHSGTGDVYCIDVTHGNCYVTDIETTGAIQVAAVRSGAVLTIDSSELDATGDIVCETYGTGSLTITNSIINNTQANGNGIKMNDLGGVTTLGNNLISVPVGSGYAVQGITGTLLYAANNVFLTANTARSTAITYVALPTTWSTKS
jgi:hypothetical protein